jgi:predicted  nucleic acid-binding Zn-ribbon protein
VALIVLVLAVRPVVARMPRLMRAAAALQRRQVEVITLQGNAEALQERIAALQEQADRAQRQLAAISPKGDK